MDMSYGASFPACENHAEQNRQSNSMKQYFECHTVLIGAVLNLTVPLTENKVAENGVIVGFSLIEEGIRTIDFTWSLLLLRFNSISFDFPL